MYDRLVQRIYDFRKLKQEAVLDRGDGIYWVKSSICGNFCVCGLIKDCGLSLSYTINIFSDRLCVIFLLNYIDDADV